MPIPIALGCPLIVSGGWDTQGAFFTRQPGKIRGPKSGYFPRGRNPKASRAAWLELGGNQGIEAFLTLSNTPAPG